MGAKGCKTCRQARVTLEDRGAPLTISEAKRHLRTCPHANDADRALANGKERPKSASTIENGAEVPLRKGWWGR